MGTYAEDFFYRFDENWQEVDMLMGLIGEMDDGDPKLKTYCRILSVLMVANLEGYLTETVRTLIRDINYHKGFSSSNYIMKKTFCSQYIPNEKGNEKRISRLVKTFDELSVQYNEEPFLYYDKNPKVTIIEKIFSNIGGKNFMGYISNREVENVFQNDSAENDNYIKKLKDRIENGVKTFPYKIDVTGLGLQAKPQKVKKCLWSSFVDEMLENRHKVAHGTSADFSLNRNNLREQKVKIVILELIFTILVYDIALNNDIDS